MQQPLAVPPHCQGLFFLSLLLEFVHRSRGLNRGSLSSVFPSAQLRDLRASELSDRPTEALFLHRLFDNVLHLLDRAIFANELPVPVTKAAVGLTLASISFCSTTTGIFGERHPAGLALLHRFSLGWVLLFIKAVRGT